MQSSGTLPDRSLIHSLDTPCCTDLDALFNSARMSARKAQNATAPLLVYHVFEYFVSPFRLRQNSDELGDRSVRSGVRNTQGHILSLRTVKTRPYSPTPAVRDFDETSGYGTTRDWCISGVSWIQ